MVCVFFLFSLTNKKVQNIFPLRCLSSICSFKNCFETDNKSVLIFRTIKYFYYEKLKYGRKTGDNDLVCLLTDNVLGNI